VAERPAARLDEPEAHSPQQGRSVQKQSEQLELEARLPGAEAPLSPVMQPLTLARAV
jgi:hypothetical protein